MQQHFAVLCDAMAHKCGILSKHLRIHCETDHLLFAEGMGRADWDLFEENFHVSGESSAQCTATVVVNAHTLANAYVGPSPRNITNARTSERRIIHGGICSYITTERKNERTYTVTSPNDTINPLIPLILFFSLFFLFCPIRSRFRFRIPLLFHSIFVCILHFFYSRNRGRLSETGNYCVCVCVWVCPGLLSLREACSESQSFFIHTNQSTPIPYSKAAIMCGCCFFSFFFSFSHHYSHLQSVFILDSSSLFPFRSLISTIQLGGVSLILFSFLSSSISPIFHGIFHLFIYK